MAYFSMRKKLPLLVTPNVSPVGEEKNLVIVHQRELTAFYRAMLCISAVYAGTRCCPSVRPSVCHVPELRQNE